jgi:predicted transposase/invertase (TIGR01784 family)
LFDNISKFLVTEYPADFANWLLGQQISLTTLNPTELNLEPIRADAVVFLSAPKLILHLEFQTAPDANMPLRMADYYMRLKRKFPQQDIKQVVIYLRKTSSKLVLQNEYITNEMRHQFRVIRLWEEKVSDFLTTPGLLPYAVLASSSNKEVTLQQVVQRIEDIADHRQKSNLVAATSILAGLELSQEVIRKLIKSDIMQESVIYQEILREGEAKGEARGLQKEQALILRQLTRKLGSIPAELPARINSLSIEQLESLGEALFDFNAIADLKNWLDKLPSTTHCSNSQ